MQLISKTSPPYLPEPDQVTVLRLGIMPLAIADWLQFDEDFAAFHAHKSNVLQEATDRVCLCLPESRSAQEQFANYLLQVLRQHHGDTYSFDNASLQHLATGHTWPLAERTLAHSSRWIQEDICLLEPAGDDYIMTAASVCAPSNWKLEDKIGRTLESIHSPVPGYADELADRVNRMLAGIRVGKSLLRYNWSLQSGNELLWRPDQIADTTQADLFWRVERQSLLRIPDTAIIVFSIRIYLHPLQQLVLVPGFREHLQAILQRLPAEQIAYKGLLDKLIV